MWSFKWVLKDRYFQSTLQAVQRWWDSGEQSCLPKCVTKTKFSSLWMHVQHGDDRKKWKWKAWKNMYQSNTNQNKAGVTMYYKINLKAQSSTYYGNNSRDKHNRHEPNTSQRSFKRDGMTNRNMCTSTSGLLITFLRN